MGFEPQEQQVLPLYHLDKEAFARDHCKLRLSPGLRVRSRLGLGSDLPLASARSDLIRNS